MKQGEMVPTALNTPWGDTPDLPPPPPPPPPAPARLELNPHPHPVESPGEEYDDRTPLEVALRLFDAGPNYGPPPPVCAKLEVNPHPQPAESQGGGFSRCIPLGADPQMMAAPTIMCNGPLCQDGTMQPSHLYSQRGAYWQEQCNNLPAVTVPIDLIRNLRPVAVLNGVFLYKLPQGFFVDEVSVAPPPYTSRTKRRKRKCESQQDNNRPYIKKPLNAFMLYLKEQRPNVVAELNNRGSVAVNRVVAERWNSLPREEQAKYYEQAERERRLHAQRHPGWSTCVNYGKKRQRKRERRKAPTRAKEGKDQETAGTKAKCGVMK